MFLTLTESTVVLRGVVNIFTIISDLIIRGYVKMWKKWMTNVFFSTEKTKQVLQKAKAKLRSIIADIKYSAETVRNTGF